MITFRNLSIQFNHRQIITDFSAEIAAGQFIAVLGPNGAGKSTLLRTLLGLVLPTSGDVLITNQKVTAGNNVIGYIPQIRHFFLNNRLSGRIRLLACLHGKHYFCFSSSRSQEQWIDELINLVGATSFADRPFIELSGGERQRLLLAQALLHRPQILLLDEPLAGLDIKYQYKFIEIIKHIQTVQSVTVLITAHDINPLLSALDKVIYLAAGKCAMGTAEEVINSQTLSQLYGTTIDVIKHNNHLLVYNRSTETTT